MSCDCNCNDDPEVKLILGQKGADGNAGWSPLFSIATDNGRKVIQITGWTGGTGTSPSITNQYLGTSGIVTDITQAVDVKGAVGATGATGIGLNGWGPIFSVVSNGSGGYVLQIVDWSGGTGTKPSIINQFIGATGIVNTAAAAVNIRGVQGEIGATGPAGTDTANGRLKVSNTDTTLNYLFNKLVGAGLVSITRNNPGSNETVTISTRDAVVDDQTNSTSISVLGSTNANVLTYTTPNDGITRKYNINFSCLGYIDAIDGTGRTSEIYVSLWINGIFIKEVYIPIYSRAGYSRAEHLIPLNYAGSIAAGKAVEIKAKKGTDSPGGNPVKLRYKNLSIFGI